jgi:hypothetical protein
MIWLLSGAGASLFNSAGNQKPAFLEEIFFSLPSFLSLSSGLGFQQILRSSPPTEITGRGGNIIIL